MTELKPCPFCGGEARVEDNPLGTDNEGGNIRGGVGLGWLWTVECGECGANAGLWQSEAVAAASWNHRAALSEADFAAAVHDGGLWRKERACRMDGPDPVYWRCTSCGAFVRRDAVADCYRVIPATWCPNCRARIERGDEG